MSKATLRKISDSDRLEWVISNSWLVEGFGRYRKFQMVAGRSVVTRSYDNPRDAIDEAITMGLSSENAGDYHFLHFEKGRYTNEKGRRKGGPRKDGLINTATGKITLPNRK